MGDQPVYGRTSPAVPHSEDVAGIWRINQWMKARPSTRARQNQGLLIAITRQWNASRGSYGAPRIYEALRVQGWKASRPRIARRMRKAGIASKIRPKWITTTDSGHPQMVSPNLLDRNFNPEQLSQAWVSDITYLPSEKGWLYLTTVMDLGDRRVIGWALSQPMKAQDNTLAALKKAVSYRSPKAGLIFHSDRGSQYCTQEFRERLAAHGMKQSMSRKGNGWDNAPAESFFKTLKYEAHIPPRFASYSQAKRVLFDYIECWYNTNRLHSALGYKTPKQREQQLTQKFAA